MIKTGKYQTDNSKLDNSQIFIKQLVYAKQGSKW